MQSFLIFDWKAVEKYFTVVLFVFQFPRVFNFGKIFSFGLGTVRSERVNEMLSVEYKKMVFTGHTATLPLSNFGIFYDFN